MKNYFIMLARSILLKNKKCCGNGCLMCPYEPKHAKDSNIVREEIIQICSNEELDLINKINVKIKTI